MQLRCSDNVKTIPTSIKFNITNDYLFQFEHITAVGCPTSKQLFIIGCPIDNNMICRRHGTCAYDRKAKVASCHCNIGYTGPNCEASKVINTIIVVKPNSISLTTVFMITSIVIFCFVLILM